MRKLQLIAVIALGCAVATPQVSAQTANFIYTGVPVAPILPGSTFTIHMSIQVVTGNFMGNFLGLSYWFAQSSPGGFGFQLNSRVTGVNGQPGASLFTDLFSPDLQLPQTMDPINRNPNGTTTSTDLGAFTQLPAQPSGTWFIADITFQVRPDAVPGAYTLGNTTNTTPGVGSRISVWFDDDGDAASIAASPFTITVVPEPDSFALMVVGAVGAGLAIYGRRRHPRLTMRWSERRTAPRPHFEMTSTLPLRATRALVRRRSSCSR